MRGLTVFGIAAGTVAAIVRLSATDQPWIIRGIAPAPRLAAGAQGDFRWQGKLAAGRIIEIKGISGDVRATPAEGDEVLVTAAKHARRSDPDDVRIEVIEHDDGVTICAVYPSSRWDRPNDCTHGQGGHSNTRNNDVRVDFTVRVPAGVRFSGHTVNGDVTATSMAGEVDAHTVNGSVEVSTRGYAEASTVNGSIRAALGDARWPEGLDFSTVNGRITLDLPANAAAEVRAETVNGDIESDFPLTVRGRFGPRRVTGTIGDGGRRLDLSTVNGDIQIRRAL